MKHHTEQLEFTFIRKSLCPKCDMLPLAKVEYNHSTGQTKVVGLYCILCDLDINESPVIGTTFQN